MNALKPVDAPLYSLLLGPSWDTLAESVRGFHARSGAVQSVGTFEVRHGASLAARLMARLARLPAEGSAVDVRLTTTSTSDGETWSRSFAGRPLVSRQRRHPDGLLAESVGPLELLFRLEAVEGTLVYRAGGAALRLGPLRVPLPSWAAPRVTASERPGDAPGQTHVAVEMRLPLLGLIVVYGGLLTTVEAPA